MRFAILATCLWGLYSTSVLAQDAPAAKWQGAYIGADGGAMFSHGFDEHLLTGGSQTFSGEAGIAGVYSGYNWQNGPWVVGAEGDWTRINNDPTEDLYTLRGRLGYTTGLSLLYATLGAGTQNRYLVHNATGERVDHRHYGVALGGGYELALPNSLIFRAEGFYFGADKQQYDFGAMGTVPAASDDFDYHKTILRAGISYHFN